MAVQLAYHGTKSPISQIQSQGFRTGNLRSIAPGQVFMSNNPAFSAGYGNTIKMAAPKSTFSLPSKNLATGAWGKELITSPKAATKMMNLANYAEGLVGSPTAKKFLSGQTVYGLGKKAISTLAGKTLGGLGYLFDPTSVADATMPEYGSEEYKTLMAKEALFRRKQKQANVFKQIKQKQLADEVAAKKAADEAAAKKAAAKKKYSGQGAQGGGGGTNIGGGQQTSSGIAGGRISHSAARAARGNMSGWGLADGGLINFYRYGGFV